MSLLIPQPRTSVLPPGRPSSDFTNCGHDIWRPAPPTLEAISPHSSNRAYEFEHLTNYTDFLSPPVMPTERVSLSPTVIGELIRFNVRVSDYINTLLRILPKLSLHQGYSVHPDQVVIVNFGWRPTKSHEIRMLGGHSEGSFIVHSEEGVRLLNYFSNYFVQYVLHLYNYNITNGLADSERIPGGFPLERISLSRSDTHTNTAPPVFFP